MLIQRSIDFKRLILYTSKGIFSMAAYASAVVIAYAIFGLKFVSIPWAIIPVVGVAVSFYLGFKNNSAYDRTWEARKIWGGIVNSSRSWGIMARDFAQDIDGIAGWSEEDLKDHHQTLLYRHIAWLYQHRRQLLVHRTWEHYEPHNKPYRDHLAKNFFSKTSEEEIEGFLSPEELEKVMKSKNPATQLIANQSAHILELRKKGVISDFQFVKLEGLLEEFYTLQGKNEPIKNFPLPRQYATSSLFFTFLFIFLLPLGMVKPFDDLGPWMVWMTIPFTSIVGWLFLVMEIVGDYAENPFEGLAFDIPMTSLCRTIEIDMREMLGETELPDPIQPVDNVLL